MKKKPIKVIIAALLWFLCLNKLPLMAAPTALIVWNDQAATEDEHDQQGFLAMLSSIGLIPIKTTLEQVAMQSLSSDTLLIIPNSSAKKISTTQAKQLLSFVSKGTRVVMDGTNALLPQLKLKLNEPTSVRDIVYMPDAAGIVQWSKAQSINTLHVPSPNNVKIIYETQQHQPLVVVGRLGKGSYMVIGPLFDPIDGRGYARFPNVLNSIVTDLSVTPAARASKMSAYLDLSDRVGTDYQSLAKQWSESGIQVIYVSAWYFDDPEFDYDHVIAEAHRYGIKVYPWFQWPHVSQRFWDEHPEWREKTATLADAHVDWRLLMNLQNADCQRTVLTETKKFLLAHDWDGINIAEFYFESYSGPEQPEIFTPMNSVSRNQFQMKYGFDPLLLFTKASPYAGNFKAMANYYEYRRTAMNHLLDVFVNSIQEVARSKKATWPIIITTIDVLTHPELADYYGIDMKHLIPLLKSNHAMLQLEDEFFDWKLGPERYTQLGKRFNAAFPSIDFMIDVNVVSEGIAPGSRFPTLEPTGTELAQIYHAAARASSGVAFYSEYSVRPWDWPLMPYVMAANAFQGDR